MSPGQCRRGCHAHRATRGTAPSGARRWSYLPAHSRRTTPRRESSLATQGQRPLNYCNDLYVYARLFVEFTIRENLDTSPNRNPFGMRDIPQEPKYIRRYLTDNEMRKVLAYCESGASLRERTVVTVLLHTGILASELANLKASDIVEIQGKWKLHIHEGKGLMDRLIPLTPQCLAALRFWQEQGRASVSSNLFTNHYLTFPPFDVWSIVAHGARWVK